MTAVCAKDGKVAMLQPIKWLFVYGTLLSRSRDPIGDDMRRNLHRRCIKRRRARISGLLYDLGGYPGWVEQPGGSGWVDGEVLLLSDPAEAFTWLDPYENIDSLHPDSGEYARIVRQIQVGPTESLRAWVYGYRGDLIGRRRISKGKWLTK